MGAMEEVGHRRAHPRFATHSALGGLHTFLSFFFFFFCFLGSHLLHMEAPS